MAIKFRLLQYKSTKGIIDPMSTTSSKTNKQFMILSALGILFVVDAHAWSGLGIMTSVFPYNSFFMPMFCFISGYFFSPEKIADLPKYLLRKARALLIPFFIWNLIYGILTSVLRYADFITYGSPLSFKTLFIRPFLDCAMFEFTLPSWFVPALFLVIFVYSLLRKFMMRFWNPYIMTFIFIWIGIMCVYFSRHGYNHSYMLIILKTGFFLQFYHIGNFFQTHIEAHFHHPLFVISATSLINVILIYITNDQIYFNDLATMSGFLTNYYWLPLLTSLTGICFWLTISKILVPAIGDHPVITYISENTFTIMMHHVFFFNIYNLLLTILVKSSVLHLPFDIQSFRNTAWYRFEPFNACKIVYVIFGLFGPLLCKYLFQRYLSHIASVWKKINPKDNV